MQVELSEDILRQVGITSSLPENTQQKQLKFDAAGTAHILCRNADEKLLKDIPIVNKIDSQDDSVYDIQEQIDLMRKDNKVKNNQLFEIILMLAVLTTVAFGLMYYILK